MTEISAKVICDSVNPAGVRLTTLELVFPRFILAEFNTHRMFSRNGASSRATPFAKTMGRVASDPFVPLKWGSNQKGMTTGEAIERVMDAEDVWLDARGAALDAAQRLADLGVHKNLCNRLLEPFSWMTMIVTSTDFANFLFQRNHLAAEDHMQVLAESMFTALGTSIPIPVGFGSWHLPYIAPDDWAEIAGPDDVLERSEQAIKLAKISAARCARVSYLTHDGYRDLSEDFALFKRLVDREDAPADPGHWSPLEHPAVALPNEERIGNFRGWLQFRKFFTAEYLPG